LRSVDLRVPPHEAPFTREQEVERPTQAETVEAMESCCSLSTAPDRFADVEKQFPQFASEVCRSPVDTKCVRSDLDEEAALDSATKLAIGQARVVGLHA